MERVVHKVYDLSTKEDTAKIKINGRSPIGDDGIHCDSSVSGIEFNAYIDGEVKIYLNAVKGEAVDENMENCYFTLYIDGKRSETRFKAVYGENTLTLASFETPTVHNIRLVKQTGAHGSLCTLKNLEFTGYFEEKPADSELYIEFVGDSITVGYGNLCTQRDDPFRGKPLMQDGTKGFAYLTAEKLGADISSVCVSGMGIAKGFRKFLVGEFFEPTSYYRDPSEVYKPTRKPDVVVINLGTNDQAKEADSAELMQNVESLINAIRAKHGESVPIVWVHGMMGNGRWANEISLVIEKRFGGENGKVYSLERPQDNGGGGGHPGLAAHESASEALSEFIKTTVLGQ